MKSVMGLTGSLLMAIAAFGNVAASDVLVAPFYNANYDAILKVEGHRRQVQSRSRFRSTEALPIDMGNYKVEIEFLAENEDRYRAEVAIFKKNLGSWIRLDAAPTFEGQLGVPVEFKWESEDVQLDLAVVTGIAP